MFCGNLSETGRRGADPYRIGGSVVSLYRLRSPHPPGKYFLIHSARRNRISLARQGKFHRRQPISPRHIHLGPPFPRGRYSSIFHFLFFILHYPAPPAEAAAALRERKAGNIFPPDRRIQKIIIGTEKYFKFRADIISITFKCTIYGTDYAAALPAGQNPCIT